MVHKSIDNSASVYSVNHWDLGLMMLAYDSVY